ncbi:Phospholipase/carboxylesterase [Cordyceps militaris CM01]|uniref:Phospholipase/carboxylesterase n=1 Tax=Cordyceps militaris (strain CM01) TaxID=983644 RepID=G3JFI3_CORMM|nr:Phospholipase/carboxylesterase [Cordyceps militaris CM01]EGX93557.1 Phospholipase/carboxylesterase [Cordyceps militaris CM01]
MESVDKHVRGPTQDHTHTCTVIFLHGRDSEAKQFADELFESEASVDLAAAANCHDRTLPGMLGTVRWVFPAAPLLRSQRFGESLSQWFDMWSVEEPEMKSELQRDDLVHSIQRVLAVIEEEEKLVPRNKIFLCGISQGFATAISLLLAEGQGGFAGLIGLCSWLPFSSQIEAKMTEHPPNASIFTCLQTLYRSEENQSILDAVPNKIRATPVLLGHAADDAVVPMENARRMNQILSALGLNVEWHEYEDGGHWINEPQGVDDIVSFIQANV